jgi:hypothetical protein
MIDERKPDRIPIRVYASPFLKFHIAAYAILTGPGK